MTTAPTRPTRRTRTSADSHAATAAPRPLAPAYAIAAPELRIYTGDCREIIPHIPEAATGEIDLIFADPPFNWNRAYDKWDDAMPRQDYLEFTYQWLDLCAAALRPGGAFWVNIPDDTAAEIVVHLKKIGLEMENWCIWHYRFGQNTRERFINSKVHALYFTKPAGLSIRETKRRTGEENGRARSGADKTNNPERGAGDDAAQRTTPSLPLGASPPRRVSRTWNAADVLEPSDRATTYFDPRTENKRDGMPAGKRVPMDVWYGQYWGRIQGNNKERRHNHDNQLPEVYLERVIRACSNEGDLVMDPFLGSGTTGVIAHALNRRFLGCEYSNKNAESCFERIQAGPARPLGTSLTQSSAIRPPRRMGEKTRQRLNGIHQLL